MTNYVKENGKYVPVELLPGFHNVLDPEKVLVKDSKDTLRIVNINDILDALPTPTESEVDTLKETVAMLMAELDAMNKEFTKQSKKVCGPAEDIENAAEFLFNMFKTKH